MKYVKKFEGFKDLFKSKPTLGIRSKLDNLLKNPDNCYDADAKNDSIFFSFTDKNGISTFLISKMKSGNYELSTLESEEKIELSQDEFKNYHKICKDLSDRLDSESDNKKSSIGSDGSLNLNVDESEIEKMEIIDKFNKIFKEDINKKYEFEIKIIKHPKNIIERYDIKVKELIPNPFFGKEEPSITVDILVDWNGVDYKIHMTENTKTEYFDLENAKLGQRGIFMFHDNESLTRKEKRDLMSNKNKPPITVECSPSKYDTIQFLSRVKETIILVNEEISDKSK